MNSLFFREVDARVYAWLRIALAIVILIWFWGLRPVTVLLFSDQGWSTMADVRQFRPDMLEHFSLLFSHPDATFVEGLLNLGFGLAILYGLGIATPLTGFLLWLVVASFRNKLPFADGGSGAVNQALFIMLFLPTWKCVSVDALVLRRCGVTFSTQALNWGLTILRFQLCMAYFSSGLIKMMGAAWVDGSALELALTNANHTRLPMVDGCLVFPLWLQAILNAATLLVLAFEVLFPLLVLWKPLRVVSLIFGVLMHIGIEATMDVGIFSYIMVSLYLSYLDPKALAEAWRAGLWTSFKQLFRRP